MPQTLVKTHGGCRCNRLGFEIDGPPLITMACHCTGCQRMTSSAFALTAIIPAQNFRITLGEAVRGGLQQGGGGHFFCDFCKTWVFTRPDDAPVVNVRPTLFENARWSAPFIEVFTSEKLPWAVTSARHSFARFPDWSEFPNLTAAFAEQVAADG